jgi:hypothetical protein
MAAPAAVDRDGPSRRRDCLVHAGKALVYWLMGDKHSRWFGSHTRGDRRVGVEEGGHDLFGSAGFVKLDLKRSGDTYPPAL